MELRAAAALLLVLAATAGCGDDPVPVASPTPVPATTAPASPVASPAPAASSSAAAAPSSPAFAGDTATDTEEPAGAPLTVTSVRVARQDGFDRVVFELDGGKGAPGWRVEYDDTPSRDGSGRAVAVEGETALAIVITGIGMPFETGVDELDEDPALPGDLDVVTDVVVGSTFEGSYEAFIGVSGERPFTVQRMSGPARVVIDVAHD